MFSKLTYHATIRCCLWLLVISTLYSSALSANGLVSLDAIFATTSRAGTAAGAPVKRTVWVVVGVKP